RTVRSTNLDACGNLCASGSWNSSMMAAVTDERSAEAPRGRELDRATLDRCKRGDPLAFRAFVVRYERAVFAVLSRILGRGPHVED
ncbi:hypothetical protein C1Y03_30850, partial [Pseudomonas sp. FW306-02-H05-AA]